jgi:hypothetical protein
MIVQWLIGLLYLVGFLVAAGFAAGIMMSFYSVAEYIIDKANLKISVWWMTFILIVLTALVPLGVYEFSSLIRELLIRAEVI